MYYSVVGVWHVGWSAHTAAVSIKELLKELFSVLTYALGRISSQCAKDGHNSFDFIMFQPLYPFFKKHTGLKLKQKDGLANVTVVVFVTLQELFMQIDLFLQFSVKYGLYYQ